MTEHWLDRAKQNHSFLNLVGHQNFPRISAITMVRLNDLRQKLLGTNRSLYEQQLIDNEANTIL